MSKQISGTSSASITGKVRGALRSLRAQLQSKDGVLSIDGLDATIRALAIAVIVALSLAGFGQADEIGARSAWVVGALVLYNALAVTIFGVPFRHRPGFTLFVVDWVVASVAIIVTGGFFSPFVVLYYALAIGAALRLGLYRSILLVAGCSVVFVALTITTSLLPGAVRLPIMVVEITSLLMVVVTTVGMSHTTEVEARRLGTEEQEATQLRRLNDYTQAVLAASPDLRVVLQTVAAAVRTDLGADRALAVLTPEQDHVPGGSGMIIATDNYPAPPQLSRQETDLLRQATAANRAIIGKVPHNGSGVICAPLVIGSEVLGAVFAYFDGSARSGEVSLARLRNVCAQLSLAIRLTRLYELERKRATRSEESERVERDLLSVVSHELRTPLTAIKTGVGALKSTHAHRPIQAENEQIEGRLILNMERSTERLILLVDELLDMARLRAKRVTLNSRPLNMPELITDVVSQAQPILDERAQIIHLDLPAPGSHRWDQLRVMGDRRKLEQVLLNLLSNANKYGPHGSKVTVGATAREGNVRVFVRDEGPGVSPDEQVMIFEKFYQGTGSERIADRRSHGLGLGLAIARAIVEIHGGTIGVTTAGKGSTFHFSLPLYDCEQTAARTTTPVGLEREQVGIDL